jgi:hypothetical protein
MKKKELIRTINEVISEFDFLGNDEYLKEEENVDLLKNEDLQKQFICDSLINKKNLKTDVYDSRIGGNWEEDNFDDTDRMSIEYFLKIEYKYDQSKEPIKFDLNFYADKVDVGKTGWQDRGHVGGTPETDREPSGEAWFDRFDWRDINVDLYTPDGDEIKFIAFEKAPPKIQILFIREFCQDFIMNYTNLDIRTPEMRDTVRSVPYC